jgi:DNA-binding IclR family transcriptional regulator
MKTVETSWDIIHLLEELDGARVMEIADRLDLAKSTVSTHLNTLKQKKYVVKDGQQYRLSLYFLNIGEYVKSNLRLFSAGKDEINDLAKETEAYAHLVAEEYGRAIYIHEAQGKHAVGEKYFTKKFLRPARLHSSAYGKAILAYLPEEQLNRIIEEHGLPAETGNTITDPEVLFEDLKQVRERGFSLNDEEEIRGMRAVGAPVREADGSVLGAISVSKPTSRMRDETFQETIPELVVSTANVIEVNIETSEKQI